MIEIVKYEDYMGGEYRGRLLWDSEEFVEIIEISTKKI